MNELSLLIICSVCASFNYFTFSEEEIYGKPGNATIASIFEPLEQNANEANISVWDEINKVNNISKQAEETKDYGRVSSEDYMLQREAKVLYELSEGDMLLDGKDRELEAESISIDQNGVIARRSIIPYLRKLWFNRIIPYEVIHEGTQRVPAHNVKALVEESLKQIMKKTCLVFRDRNYNDRNWIRFFKGSGCYSGIGRKFWTSQPTKISLGEYCVHLPIIIHEVLHAIGFFHEQSRVDRDSFITIRWENINPALKDQFVRHLSYDGTIQNTPYDYLSIMHYGKTAFTYNGLPTIEAKFDPNQPLGGKVLSDLDAEEINKMYQCQKVPSTLNEGRWSEWTQWTGDCFEGRGRGCITLRQRFCLSANYALCPGVDEYGVEDHYKACPPQNCTFELVQPHWGKWSEYTSCSTTCGEGIQSRSRKCNNPPPARGLYCKGAKTQTTLCRRRKCEPDWKDTNFDNGFGMWRHDKFAELNWKLIRGPTPSLQSGPKADHTSRSGQYAYLTSTDLFRHDKKVGRLISQQIPVNYGTLCVTFYYQLNGKSIGYLDFYTKTTKSNEFRTYWSRKGHQGNFWRKGAFTIPAKDEPYEIVIEGRVGVPPHSDIAIDDVQMDRGPCLDGTEGCNNYYSQCDLWRLHGECYKNYRWMLRSCCFTCADMAECLNVYQESMCIAWSYKNECINNPKWMWQNCCKACRNCMDKHRSCRFWATKGECGRNPWMRENCKTSCKICSS